MFKKVAGTKDILPDQISAWQKIEDAGEKIFTSYNYQEIRPPLIEESALFNRSLGEATEIVQKQMFLIKSGTDEYALRPEATASIVRAYIENSLDKQSRLCKFYYTGPMFRMERPQKGRLRQFHHLGCEVIGAKDPGIDIEIITLADTLLKAFSIDGYITRLNSLGCLNDKKKLIDILKIGLKDRIVDLCEDCKLRFQRNILRILDCKNEACQQIVHGLGIKDSYLCQDCKDHFFQVRAGLDELSVPYELSPYLVRGLDYYTRTVFEFTHDELGPQQNALGAGGRYDTLISSLGGPDTGAIGFAFGMERLLLVSKLLAKTQETGTLVYIISLGEAAKKASLKILYMLRNKGIAADTEYEGKSLKAALRKADDLKARFVVIIGDNELQKNVVMLKDMSAGTQKEVLLEKLIEEIKF